MAAGVFYQLRDYRTKPGELTAFIDEWRAGVVPLRQQFGFTVIGAWAIEAEDRFVWILGYDGPEFEARDAAYYDSPERAALEPDPARRIAEMEIRMMTSVLGELSS